LFGGGVCCCGDIGVVVVDFAALSGCGWFCAAATAQKNASGVTSMAASFI
jgi:hypothetical protein